MNKKSILIVLSLSAVFVLPLILTAPVQAQFKTELVNDEGATAPCVGVDFTGAIRKCAEEFEHAGFIRVEEVGVTGMTLGTDGNDDGAVTHLDPGGPAAMAGFQMGDVIFAVDGKPVPPTLSAIAERLTFGARGTELNMKVLRNGAPIEVHLVRTAGTPPPAPKSPGRLYMFRPMVDWRGQFIPCMGVGPAGLGAIAFCEEHFKSFGFIKMGDYGMTGFHLDPATTTGIITSVDPGSPAATAGILPGDQIVSVDGKPVAASRGMWANMLLFGKAGAARQVMVRRGQSTQTIMLTLGAKR